MKIAQVAPLHLPAPPPGYGGTERCIYNLTEGLVSSGHEVTLYASGDSSTSAQLVAPIPFTLGFNPPHDATAFHLALLTEVYQQAHTFDVIHSHLKYLTLPFTNWTATPTVITIHGRLDSPGRDRVLLGRPPASFCTERA